MPNTTKRTIDGVRSLHEQISESLRFRIRSGDLAVGQRLPGETELCDEFGTSRGTVRRALRTLNEEGIVQTFQGRGTFVLSGRPQPSIGQRLVGLGEALSYSAKSLRTAVLSSQILEPGSHPGYEGFCGPEARVMLLDRVRYLDDVPVARLLNWVKLDLAPGFEECDFTQTSLFDALDACAERDVASGRRSFEAVLPNADVAASLEIAQSQPLLLLHQVTYLDDGTAIERSDVWMDSTQVVVSTYLSR